MQITRKYLPYAIVESFASLELTILCLSILMILIVLCTLAEIQMGTFEAVRLHFYRWFFYSHPVFGMRIPIFPAGKLVGATLIINLIAAHIYRFELAYKKVGLWLVHFGLILLFIGQFMTAHFSNESQMSLQNKKPTNYSESLREFEIAIINASNPTFDQVTSISGNLLKPGRKIQIPQTHLSVQITRYYPNAAIEVTPQDKKNTASAPLIGLAKNLSITEIQPVNSDDQYDQPAAEVELLRNEKSIGRWFLTSAIPLAQIIPSPKKSLYIVLRPKRYYFPFSLSLQKFTHARYAGTDIPQKFLSLVTIKDLSRGEERNFLISMNHPLRYRGRTFYQAAFAKKDTVSILQVVKNPSWILPYLASFLTALGLLLHFLMRLKRNSAPTSS